MNVSILLASMLLGGLIFVCIPTDRRDKGYTSLKITKSLTSELKAIVLFVSEPRPNETVEDLLAYKVLAQIDSSRESAYPRHVWLLHSHISSGDGSSYRSASLISKRFNSKEIQVHTRVIDDVLDANTVFPVIRDILRTRCPGVREGDIVCDCTSGTKLVTLGTALASFGDAKIVYFPRGAGQKDDASEYVEIGAGVFQRSLNVERSSL